MNDVLYLLQGAFELITSVQLFGVPVIYIFIGLIILTLLMNFIRGER